MDLDSFNLVYSRFAHVKKKKSFNTVSVNVFGIAVFIPGPDRCRGEAAH